MPRPEPTEITFNKHGDETHESWILVRFNHISSNPGAKLFDSEIRHQHFVRMTVSRCSRQRDLNRDWLHDTTTLIEVDMSQAQFGAVVSSFGSSGVPATLSWFDGALVPEVATHDSRLAKSHEEVKGAAAKAMQAVKEAHAAVAEGFEQKLGVKEMRMRMRDLQIRIDQLPGNMEFAAKSLTEHVENVVTKARADVEGMAYQAAQRGMVLDGSSLPVLESGEISKVSPTTAEE